MDRRWLPLNALRAFEVVGQHLSITAAANKLFVSQSAVSRHVLTLEGLLGVKLFERKHHHLELTEAGRALLPVVAKSFDRIEHVLKEVIKDGGTPRQTLRLQMPPSFAHNLAVPILRDFHASCPEVIMEVSSPYNVGMSSFDSDAAVMYSKPEVNEMITDLLWNVRISPICHPSLIHDLTPNDLATFIATNEIVHVMYENQPRHRIWERFIRQAELSEVAVDRGLVFDTANLAMQYIKSGEGIGLLDPMLFQDELRTGQLVQPFDVWLDDGYGYYLLTHPEDLSNEAISLFRSWMINRFTQRSNFYAPSLKDAET